MIIDLDEGHRKRDERADTDIQVNAAAMSCVWVGIRERAGVNVRSHIRREIRTAVFDALEAGVTSDIKLGVWTDVALWASEVTRDADSRS